MKKLLALLLALAMVLSLVACSSSTPDVDDSTPDDSESTPVEGNDGEEVAVRPVITGEYGVDYISLYDQFGADVSIADVVEDTATGLAYIERDGVQYELGLDFLTMAMVYNTDVPAGGRWTSEDDVYATWWKLYIQRWNVMLPEIPLYSNEYYDVYNALIKGVEEHPTNPFWSPASALIDWTSEKDDTIILGNSTELSGRLRNSSFGVSSPGAGDNDVMGLITGLDTVVTTKEGGYVWNETVVKDHSETDNADGSRTYTITLHDDLLYSDGSPITAKDYLTTVILFSTPMAVQAGGSGTSGMNYVGFADFAAYDGTEGSGSKVFSGFRLIDDYTFSATVDAAYLPYFYAIAYGGFAPQPMALWGGADVELLDDGDGVYLSDNAYAMSGEDYVVAGQINAGVWDKSTNYPYSGPYTISNWDDAAKTVTLTANPYFKGNYEGTKPGIGTVVYKRIISETQLADFQAGGVDVLAGVTGGSATDEAIALVEANPDLYVATHYSRAGYGKLGFRADLGPAQFTEVRQAIAYCMDRAQFALDFTGGYGGVTNGPYYTGSWMYQAAVADGMVLNTYPTSADSAIAVLEAGGWVYDAEGNPYTSGVRYKKIPAANMYESDITYASRDGAYTVTKVGDDYYMPLVLNWYGTADNEFTDLLVTGFMNNDNMAAAGFVVQNNIGDFNPMLDELTQGGYGVSYNGVPTYNCFNFATGFNSAVYDYSWNMTIDPSLYDIYSSYYIKDLADVYYVG